MGKGGCIMNTIIFIISSMLANFIIFIVIWSMLFIMLSRMLQKMNVLLVISFVLTIILALFVTRRIGILLSEQSLILPILIVSSNTLLHIMILRFTLFYPLPGPIFEKVIPENTNYIKLRSGSDIAYWHYKATKDESKPPIIYVHGGPGAHTRNIDRAFLSSFAEEGYDVLCYDQSGGGFSGYLTITEYSMERCIKDLEELRLWLNVDRIILIGQSFGARICSYYAAKYENHVESIIFTGPAGLTSSNIIKDIKSKKQLRKMNIEFATSEDTKFKPTIKETVRFAFTILTAKIGGPVIAEQITSQKEITEYATRMIPDAIARAYHKKYKDLVPTITSGGINVLVNVVLNNNYDKINMTMLPKLSNSSIPVLILRSAYDYVSWEDQKFYKTIFRNHYLVYIPESGHVAWSVNKEATYYAITHFMNQRYDSLECYKGETNPLIER